MTGDKAGSLRRDERGLRAPQRETIGPPTGVFGRTRLFATGQGEQIGNKLVKFVPHCGGWFDEDLTLPRFLVEKVERGR